MQRGARVVCDQVGMHGSEWPAETQVGVSRWQECLSVSQAFYMFVGCTWLRLALSLQT